MQLATKEFYSEVVANLEYGIDSSALACTCRLFRDYHRDLKASLRFQVENENSLFYANYRLSDHQLKTLRHLLLTEERRVLCLTPKGAGRKVTALVYAQELLKRGESVIIAVPTESVASYCTTAERLGITVSPFKKAIQTDAFRERLIYVLDRSNTYRMIDFESCGVGCLILDAPDKGQKSFLNFCQDAARSSVRAVLLGANVGEEERANGYLEVAGIARDQQFFALRFSTYIPEMKKRVLFHPEIWFYLCLDAPGSYYSVQPETRRGIWSQDVLQDIVRFRAKKPVVLCTGKKARLEVEPLVSARYVEINHLNTQLLGFTDYIFYNFVGTEEKLRHLIDKLPLHGEQPLRIWIITDTPSLAYSVVAPKEMVDSYQQYMGRFQSTSQGLSSVSTKCYRRKLSLEEATVFARKSSFPKASADWLTLQEGTLYSPNEIVSIIREKKCLFLQGEEGCSVKDLEPIVVKAKESYEQEPITNTEEENKELEIIVNNPTKKGLATVEELRRRCRLLGISPTGKKQELAQRLIDCLNSA